MSSHVKFEASFEATSNLEGKLHVENSAVQKHRIILLQFLSMVAIGYEGVEFLPRMASERWPTSTMLKAALLCLCRSARCLPKLG
jgi:hypothetical protein